MTGQKPDEDIRLPMQWTSDDGLCVGFTEGRPWRFPAADYENTQVALQDEDKASLLNHYRPVDPPAQHQRDAAHWRLDSGGIGSEQNLCHLRSYGDRKMCWW